MKTKNIYLLFLMCLIATSLFAQKTIIVNDSNDIRLKAYKDSMACYKFGLYQVYSAKCIKNRNDTYEGGLYLYKMNQKSKELGLPKAYNWNGANNSYLDHIKIQPISQRTDLTILCRVKDNVEHKWDPDVYKKPTVTVLYKPLETNIENMLTKNDTINNILDSTIVVPKIVGVYILMPDGTKLSKEDYIAKYSQEGYDKIFK